MKHGLTHVYTGDGKGKTTAAIGLAVRAAGCGLRVEIFQFCKESPSGELPSLALLPRVTVKRAQSGIAKFTFEMSPDEKEAWLEAQRNLFDEACEAVCDGRADMVVLDEALGAMHAGAVDIKQLCYLVSHKARSTELVLTGRAAPDALLALADYATEMRCLSHPYARGTHARRGVEY